MRKAALLLMICAPLAMVGQANEPRPDAKMPSARVQAPSYTDMHCAGFITKQGFNNGNYLAGGAASPDQTQYVLNDVVFLDGSGYTEGARFSVIRPLRDPNRSRGYKGEPAAIAAAGQPYADLGRVRVTAIRGKIAIGRIEFSCAPMVPGDLVIPFEEKSPVAFRPNTAFDRFPPASNGVTGRVVLAKDFDYLPAAGQKVYLNVGADKGVKVGDYFRAVRSYDPAKMDEVDKLSLAIPQSEETQLYSNSVPKSKTADFPRHAVAEMIVINVTPTSSTAMITYSLEEVTLGDTVELEGGGGQ